MRSILSSAALLCAIVLTGSAQGPKAELQQKLAAVKESMARNQAALRRYSWTAHTEISLKGEVKKTKDDLCRYGPDGQVQKTPLGAPAPPKEMRGARKRIAERKKDELEDYMERAVALIHNYVPPSADKMQQAFQMGNAAIRPSAAGAVQLQFTNYLKQGDALTLNFNAAAKTLQTVTVNSYLDAPDDAVTLQVEFQTLPDGTNYTATTILDAAAKKLQVRVQNMNYQRVAD